MMLDPEAARTIGRLEGKLDALTTVITEIKAMMSDKHDDLDQRLRAVEKRQWWLAGAAAVLSWLASHVLNVKGLISRLP